LSLPLFPSYVTWLITNANFFPFFFPPEYEEFSLYFYFFPPSPSYRLTRTKDPGGSLFLFPFSLSFFFSLAVGVGVGVGWLSSPRRCVEIGICSSLFLVGVGVVPSFFVPFAGYPPAASATAFFSGYGSVSFFFRETRSINSGSPPPSWMHGDNSGTFPFPPPRYP